MKEKTFLQNFLTQKLKLHLRLKEEPKGFTDVLNTVTEKPIQTMIIDGKRFDVKLSNPIKMSSDTRKKIWDFDLRRDFWKEGKMKKESLENPPCDYYILVGLEDDVPKKVFLLPSSSAPTSHVRISIEGLSKYYKYAI